jgi:hypothetical protein
MIKDQLHLNAHQTCFLRRRFARLFSVINRPCGLLILISLGLSGVRCLGIVKQLYDLGVIFCDPPVYGLEAA